MTFQNVSLYFNFIEVISPCDLIVNCSWRSKLLSAKSYSYGDDRDELMNGSTTFKFTCHSQRLGAHNKRTPKRMHVVNGDADDVVVILSHSATICLAFTFQHKYIFLLIRCWWCQSLIHLSLSHTNYTATRMAHDLFEMDETRRKLKLR